MTLRKDSHLLRTYLRHGGKKYRLQQFRRLMIFIDFTEKNGIFHAGQIGEKTWKAFKLERNLSAKTLYEYRLAVNVLVRTVTKLKRAVF